VTRGEVSRLAALERTLVGAAANQVQRRRLRRRRAVVLVALAAPLLLAAAASVAATQGVFGGIAQQLATLRDDRLIPRTEPSARLLHALGAVPRERASERAWLIAGHRVSGYTTASGSFCYAFGTLTGGCLQSGELSAANPVAPTVEHGPRAFRVYGLAIDGVTGVSLRARGVTWRGLVVRNAFYLEAKTLRGDGGFPATLIVRMRGGAIKRVPLLVSDGRRPTQKFLPSLPGILPVEDTAA
jgi:hypothetical protein